MKLLSEQQVETYLVDYLIEVGGIKPSKSKTNTIFVCPFCKTEPSSASVLFSSYIFNCVKCGVRGKIFDIVRLLEKDKEQYTDTAIMEYIKEKLNIDLVSTFNIDTVFEFYNKSGFDLVPIAKNQKNPVELEWTTKSHKEIKEWNAWVIESGLNIGVKTGKISNLTIIDLDKTSEIPEEIKSIMGNPLIQKTNSGFHLFYTYEPDLKTTRIDELKIDILNDGKQCVVFPSVIDSFERNFISDFNIEQIPEELKTYLLGYTGPRDTFKTEEEKIIENINTEDFELDLVGEGNRHNFLLHLGGILRKELNTSETGFVLDLCNKKFCKPSFPKNEMRILIHSLDKYVTHDERELGNRILKYLELVEEAGSRDIKETLGENKERIETALAWLVKEGLLIKHRRQYHILKRANWKTTFPNLDNEVPFNIPFFSDIGIFNWGDMILLGGQSKVGKTTISVNFLKSFIEQGYNPHYICLETGSRWVKTALQLGLKEGDLKYDFVSDPSKIQLEDNAITIIDWLLITDKAKTDMVFQYFIEQLYKTNGFLIVFMQLKEEGGWFAPNMVHQFPSLSARYLYSTDEDRIYGNWHIDALRESRGRYRPKLIPCKYDIDTRILNKVSDTDVGGTYGD